MSVRTITADVFDGLAQLPDESVHCVVTRLSETQVAYVAGLIDGEGSLECQIQMQKGAATPIFTLRLSFTFGTEEPITTVAAWLGTAPKRYPATTPNRNWSARPVPRAEYARGTWRSLSQRNRW